MSYLMEFVSSGVFKKYWDQDNALSPFQYVKVRPSLSSGGFKFLPHVGYLLE